MAFVPPISARHIFWDEKFFMRLVALAFIISVVSFEAWATSGVSLDPLANINSKNQKAYLISGQCDDHRVEVEVAVERVQAVAFCRDGRFSTMLDVSEFPDSSSLTVSASQGGSVAERRVSKDATAPGAPLVLWPLQRASLNVQWPHIRGHGEPRASVHVLLDGRAVGEAAVDSSGGWNWLPAEALAEGEHQFSARAIDAAGNESSWGEISVWTIDVTAPRAPRLLTPQDGASVNQLEQLSVTGLAEGRAWITLFLDSQLAGSIQCDEAGKFHLTLDGDGLELGPHRLMVEAKDAAGNRSVSEGISVNVRSEDERLGGAGGWGCSSAGVMMACLLTVAWMRRR